MTRTATSRRQRIHLTIAGRAIPFDLSRDGGGCWAVAHDGRHLGLVYRLVLPGAGWRWRARPRGRPAAQVGYPTRARALVALYEATRP